MPGKRITNFEGCSYQTDAEGSDSLRACPGEAASFTWTGDGQLASYTSGGLTWSFGYGPLGRLVRRDSAGVVKSRFLWDGDNLVAELAANGTTTVAEYSYYPGGLDNLHAVWLPTPSPAYGTWYAHPDAMGNVRALVGDTGLVGRTYNYDEWGRLQGTSTDPAGFANADRARWKGALWMGPAPDLYYMRNRWYEPRTGRFLSEDPIGLEGGINPYVFAGGDPINGADPIGLDGCVWGVNYARTRITYSNGTVDYGEWYITGFTLIGCSEDTPESGPPGGTRRIGALRTGASGRAPHLNTGIRSCSMTRLGVGLAFAMDVGQILAVGGAGFEVGRAGFRAAPAIADLWTLAGRDALVARFRNFAGAGALRQAFAASRSAVAFGLGRGAQAVNDFMVTYGVENVYEAESSPTRPPWWDYVASTPRALRELEMCYENGGQ